ncbi:restriction system protein [Oxalobacteraceae bacterium GrIS 2.11]
MTIPNYQTCLLPFLNLMGDGRERTLRDIQTYLADFFELTDEERSARIPSGQSSVINNRVGWARTYLTKSGLIERTGRAIFRLTERGASVLKDSPPKIDVKFLEQFPEFIAFQNSSKNIPNSLSRSDDAFKDSTPEEEIELAYQGLKNLLAEELLTRILSCSPVFFEQLVVDLLVKMGYGGSRKDAGERIGKSGDEGIDGIIKEDRLGLDAIYIQAKRWQGSVGRPEIQKFVGALQGQRAKKGVFITTSGYTADALDYIKMTDAKVVLIDGSQLANLMIEFDLGVSVSSSYIVKKIDSDYFEEI